MLLNKTDEVLKAVVLIGSKVRYSGCDTSAREIVERLHRADADDVFDEGTAQDMARRFCTEYL